MLALSHLMSSQEKVEFKKRLNMQRWHRRMSRSVPLFQAARAKEDAAMRSKEGVFIFCIQVTLKVSLRSAVMSSQHAGEGR